MKATILAGLLRKAPIVITGVGSFSAAGTGVTSLWQAVRAGRSLAVWEELDWNDERVRFAACRAPEIDAAKLLPRSLRRADRCAQMGFLAAEEAWRQAALPGAIESARIGLMMGTSRGPLGKVAESLRRVGQRNYPASLAADSTFASPGGGLAEALAICGPSATVSATCASSAFAIALAAEQILLGKADVVLAGGTEAPLEAAVPLQLRSAGVLAFHAEAGQACRPFDRERNGLILGEGSAFIVLESQRAAEARGARPLARLAGWAMTRENNGRVGLSSDGFALLQAMRQATELAGLAPHHVDYVNAHGTGTQLNDATEARALAKFLGDRGSVVPCSSTKPVTGHCLGATPAIEAVICLEVLRHQEVPPTPNCVEQDPLCPIHVPRVSGGCRAINTVMSNSLGFWGYHASLVFQKL